MDKAIKKLQKQLDRNYRHGWIQRLWRHHWDALFSWSTAADSIRHKETGLWHCIRGTVALLFDFEDTSITEYPTYNDCHVLASKDLGMYLTEYGIGIAFAQLHVVGFRYHIVEDGSL